MGRPKLRLFDTNKRPSKPGYIRYEILGGRSWDQSRASPGAVSDQSQDQIQDQIQDQNVRPWIPVSQILELLDIP